MINFASLIEQIDDRLNPIIVKELRQVVRGRFFWGVLILFLAIQCAVLSLSIADRGLTNRSVGADTLTFLFAFLFLGSYVLVPLNSGFRFARERNEGSDELLYITTITPYSIIFGKFAASMAFILLLFSAFAPFMAMTFFLSGVDFDVTFFILALGLMVSAGGTILQICLGSLARDANAMQFFRVVGVIFQLVTYFSFNAMSSEMIRYGVDHVLGSSNSVSRALTMIAFFLGAGYFLFVAAASVIFPAGSNRMKPVRVCVSLLWLLSCGITAYWAVLSANSQAFFAWGYLASFALCSLLLVVVSERDVLTERVAREIPVDPVRSRLAFLLFSGSAGGFVWIMLLLVLTVMIVAFFWNSIPVSYMSPSSYTDFFFHVLGLSSYFFGYALLASFIRRTFLTSFVESRNTWVVALMVCAVFSIAPMFIGSVFGLDSDLLLIGSPIILGNNRGFNEGLVFAFIVMAVSLVINMPWLSRQLKEFVSARESNAGLDSHRVG